MKNKEELKNLKEEVENESRKPHELTEEDLEQVTGGGLALHDQLVARAVAPGFAEMMGGRVI